VPWGLPLTKQNPKHELKITDIGQNILLIIIKHCKKLFIIVEHCSLGHFKFLFKIFHFRIKPMEQYVFQKTNYNIEGTTEKVCKFYTPGAMSTTLYFLRNL